MCVSDTIERWISSAHLHSILSESDCVLQSGFDVFYIQSSVNLIVFYSRGLMCFTFDPQ